MRQRLGLVLALCLPCCGDAVETQPAWVSENFVGKPPGELMRSRAGSLRWVGLWGTRRLQHASLVDAVAVSADGVSIVSGCWDGMVRLWDSKSGKESRTLHGHEHSVLAVALIHARPWAP